MDCFLGLWFFFCPNSIEEFKKYKQSNSLLYLCIQFMFLLPDFQYISFNGHSFDAYLFWCLSLLFSLFYFIRLFCLRSRRVQTEWNRHLRRNYHRLRKVIETIIMQQIIKSTITQRNSIHTSRYMMMKPMMQAISTEMVSIHL